MSFKILFVCIGLSLLFVSNSYANAGDDRIALWSTMPTWHAEYRQGNVRTVVDTQTDLGQRIVSYQNGSVFAVGWTMWGGSTLGAWAKLSGDSCYERRSVIDPWQLAQEGLQGAMSQQEISGFQTVQWRWGFKQSSAGWLVTTKRKLNGTRIGIRIHGKTYPRTVSIDKLSRSGRPKSKISSIRISSVLHIKIGAPSNVCT